ncbi:unnamed protein product [Adineta steineri]|uniref:Uncharacterized protein n=1 Tax=Adineta steineri TaxID=433720 RepID=A0A815I735_9BILA|nr:unnamed protein product [Adineta steineri]
MSTSPEPNLLYDASINKFTELGNETFHSIFRENHNPPKEVIQKLADDSGVSLRKCQVISSSTGYPAKWTPSISPPTLP